MNSQIQKKKKKEEEWWNCGITNKLLMRGQNLFLQKTYEEVVLNWRTNDQIMPSFGRSFINDKCIFQ